MSRYDQMLDCIEGYKYHTATCVKCGESEGIHIDSEFRGNWIPKAFHEKGWRYADNVAVLNGTPVDDLVLYGLAAPSIKTLTGMVCPECAKNINFSIKKEEL